ncbi:hypothetical protein C3F09_10645 [candidate division GN15 bacterium]|uniref:Peptidase M50 domain-containing protein n=1 Tax=candidate division GN15 bacterium TaxID=2072418 RepID=A0A855X304_9BACT|nr:MAG: hypothetical protein C3F09_10645 [candidate division GN15 bacterium]
MTTAGNSSPNGFDRDVHALSPLLLDLFIIDAVYRHGDRIAFSLSCEYDRDRRLALVEDRLKTVGYQYEKHLSDSGPILLVIDRKARFHIPPTNLILFALTALSVYLVPVLFRSNLDLAVFRQHLASGAGLQFTLALMTILVVHEMGHFLTGRRRGIVTSWPYFIPAPNIFGTFGAVIRSKSPFWNRRDLLELGAAGPIAGWLVAIGWLIYGLTQSHIAPVAGLTPYDFGVVLKGESILMHLLSGWLVGPARDGTVIVLSEYAIAGWAGLLVTALNLIPIGQLDGGHILYGLIGRRQHIVGWLAIGALAVLGFFSPVWWVFAALGFIFRVEHPATLGDSLAPGKMAVSMGIVAFVILVLSFTPIPLQ